MNGTQPNNPTKAAQSGFIFGSPAAFHRGRCLPLVYRNPARQVTFIGRKQYSDAVSGRQRAPALCRSLGNFVALPLFLFLVFDACSSLLYRAACESLRRTPGRCNKLFVMFFPGMGKDIVSRSTGNLGVLDIA